MVPGVNTLAMPLVILEGSFVLSRAVKPLKVTFPVFLVIDPHAVVLDSCWPEVDTQAVQLVVSELTFICAAFR